VRGARDRFGSKRRWAALIFAVVCLPGCFDEAEKKEAPELYMPGSPITATPGKRYVIRDGHGANVAKWRVRSESTKIYGRDHAPLARLKRVKKTSEKGGGVTEIVATSLDGTRKVAATLSGKGKTSEVIPIGKLFRLERREDRWLITDRQELILGVITDVSPPGERGSILEVRESYALQAPAVMRAERSLDKGRGGISGQVRLLESKGEGEDKSEEVTLVVDRPLSPAILIAYAIEHEGLDPMTRAVLASALEYAIEQAPAAPGS